MRNRSLLLLFAVVTTLHAQSGGDAKTPPELRRILAQMDADIDAAKKKAVRDLQSAQKLDRVTNSDPSRGMKFQDAIERLQADIERQEIVVFLCSHTFAAEPIKRVDYRRDDKWDFEPDGTLINLNPSGWKGKRWTLSDDDQTVQFEFEDGHAATHGIKNLELSVGDPNWRFRATPKAGL